MRPWGNPPFTAWAEPATVVVNGVVTPRFTPVASVLQRIVTRYGGGAAICVYHRGRPVADLWGGVRDRSGQPWLRDTLAPSFSTTKGVAATVLHVLVDRGFLDYDDRVSRYWPEFAQAGKQDITVRQVLTHQAGLYAIRRMIESADVMLDWEAMIRALERATPLHPPGERTAYHGLTFGFLVGELVERVTGRPFSEVLRDTVALPLGLDGCYVGTPEHELHRAAQLLRPRWVDAAAPFARDGILLASLTTLVRVAERVLHLGGVQLDAQSVLDALAPAGIRFLDFSAKETLRATIPAANGVFTARALARMYAALARGGELDGARILSARTLARATERQPPTRQLAVIPVDMGWRLGYHSVLTSRGCPPNAFGHFGLGGSGAWADPDRDLAVALTVNSGVGSPLGDLRIIRTGGIALSCARTNQ